MKLEITVGCLGLSVRTIEWVNELKNIQIQHSINEVRTIIIWTNTTMTNIARKKYH